MPDRVARKLAFLDRAGWALATRRPLAGDASARSYERLGLGGNSAVLMDCPPGGADTTEAFCRVARHLSSINLSAPAILAEDHGDGFLLLEDLGDDLFARCIEKDPSAEAPLYRAAVDVLAAVQNAPAPDGLPDLDAQQWAEAAALLFDWYPAADVAAKADVTACLADALTRHADGPRVLILRDYHAENLLWLPERQGLARVGLLDFQLAQMGQPAYDLVSLLQDARRDLSAATEPAMMAAFAQATGAREQAFTAAYATLGAQRALRILGIFARLAIAERKPRYLALMPRVWAHLQRNLVHPALSDLCRLCERHLSAPTDSVLLDIEARCQRA